MAGPITTLQGNFSFSYLFTGTNTDLILGPITRSNIGLSLNQPFVNQTTPTAPAIKATQHKLYTVTVAAGAPGTTSLDLTAASANIINDATATFSKILAVAFLMPTVTSALGVALGLTVQASDVDVGKAVSNAANLFLLDNSSAIHLTPGLLVGCVDFAGTGFPLSGSVKALLFSNNDAVNAAKILMEVVGLD